MCFTLVLAVKYTNGYKGIKINYETACPKSNALFVELEVDKFVVVLCLSGIELHNLEAASIKARIFRSAVKIITRTGFDWSKTKIGGGAYIV